MDIVGDKFEGPKMPQAVQLVDAKPLDQSNESAEIVAWRFKSSFQLTMKHEIHVLYTTIVSNI